MQTNRTISHRYTSRLIEGGEHMIENSLRTLKIHRETIYYSYIEQNTHNDYIAIK